MAQTPTSLKSAFWLGYRDTIPFWLVVAPFGLLFGAVATEAGLNIVETMVMTILVVAGAAQFTALTLMSENAPTLIILAAALAVNLRMAMYSAALAPHLGREPLGMRVLYAYFMVDQSFGMAINKYAECPEMTARQKGIYYMGSFLCVFPVWGISSLVGALVGAQIPPEYALDFALPICFIALSAPMMRSLPHFVAAIVSMIGAVLFVNIPFSMGLLLAAFIAMIVAAQTEQWLERRRANG
jgi:predicted branched-subunit amino acid permease